MRAEAGGESEIREANSPIYITRLGGAKIRSDSCDSRGYRKFKFLFHLSSFIVHPSLPPR
jgi:hypothetical protein